MSCRQRRSGSRLRAGRAFGGLKSRGALVFAPLALALALALPGCEKTAPPSQESTAKAKVTRHSLEVAKAQRQFLTIEPAAASTGADLLTVPGRVAFRPQAQYAVGAMVPGRVSALLVRGGEAVKAGTPLLTIDSSDAAGARAALDQAATRLANAEIVYKRNAMMVEKGVGLEAERQDAEARLKEARAEHERARYSAALLGAGSGNRVIVRAPADGVVMKIRAAVGATVAPGGEALLELGDPSRLQILAQVPEGELSRIVVGQEAEIELPALATRAKASVESVNPRVDPESRRAHVYLAPAGRIAGLRDGMLAQVTLRVSAEGGIVVPVAAVLIKDGKRRIVYVETANGEFEAREVQTGRAQEGRVAILKGLSSGDRVVVRGALLLDTQAEQLL